MDPSNGHAMEVDHSASSSQSTAHTSSIHSPIINSLSAAGEQTEIHITHGRIKAQLRNSMRMIYYPCVLCVYAWIGWAAMGRWFCSAGQTR
jgi:hypothetical protein